MPPKAKIGKEQILQGVVEFVQKEGHENLNARSLAEWLGCSTQPIFYNFENMEKLKDEAMRRAWETYERYVHDRTLYDNYPPYKASGMGYVRFARKERELFKWLFMSERGQPSVSEVVLPKDIVERVQNSLSLEMDEAIEFHRTMWVFVHGIAVMIATGFATWTDEEVQRALTDVYQGLRLQKGGKQE